jgi:hypothetical protein
MARHRRPSSRALRTPMIAVAALSALLILLPASYASRALSGGEGPLTPGATGRCAMPGVRARPPHRPPPGVFPALSVHHHQTIQQATSSRRHRGWRRGALAPPHGPPSWAAGLANPRVSHRPPVSALGPEGRRLHGAQRRPAAPPCMQHAPASSAARTAPVLLLSLACPPIPAGSGRIHPAPKRRYLRRGCGSRRSRVAWAIQITQAGCQHRGLSECPGSCRAPATPSSSGPRQSLAA